MRKQALLFVVAVSLVIIPACSEPKCMTCPDDPNNAGIQPSPADATPSEFAPDAIVTAERDVVAKRGSIKIGQRLVRISVNAQRPKTGATLEVNSHCGTVGGACFIYDLTFEVLRDLPHDIRIMGVFRERSTEQVHGGALFSFFMPKRKGSVAQKRVQWMRMTDTAAGEVYDIWFVASDTQTDDPIENRIGSDPLRVGLRYKNP